MVKRSIFYGRNTQLEELLLPTPEICNFYVFLLLTVKKDKISFVKCLPFPWILITGYLDVLGQASTATMILCPNNRLICRVSIRIFGIFFSAGTKICRIEPATGFSCKIPQYWRHFRRTIATTRPVGETSFDFIDFSKIFADSSSWKNIFYWSNSISAKVCLRKSDCNNNNR